MKYPKLLKKNGCIGVNAPSFECFGYPYTNKTHRSYEVLTSIGYKVKYSKHCFNEPYSNIIKSADYKMKAQEFMDQYKDNTIDVIIAMAGGELEYLTIENIDFNELKELEPKFFCGYSDNTNIAFLLTTLCDVASVYGYNFNSFGEHNMHKSHVDFFNVLSNSTYTQYSYDKYELESHSHDEGGDPICDMNDVVPTCWKSLDNNDVTIKGRIIGGCLDCLLKIVGTKYDNVVNFNTKYKDDGIILFFESCDLNIIEQLRGYEQIKNANWFNHVKGILIGRPRIREDYFGATYEDVLHQVFGTLNIPVIYDFDIGHLPPQITIIEGSIAKVSLKDNKGIFKSYMK